VVWLRFADGLDLKEIAEALRIPLGTVKSRLHTAIAALRKKLADA
jgi:RNA polymerase sigma-70 factor (ECF subfamily)